METREFCIPPSLAGKRAQECLRALLPELKESVLHSAFARRDVKLDGARVGREAKVSAGQILRVYLPEGKAPAEPLEIVYEDDAVLLVNKRAGISVEADARGGVTLTDLCREHVLAAHPDAFAPAACHRLDHRTCGLCLFAKTAETLLLLQDVFRQRTLEKEYICLVRGVPKPPRATCRAYLVKDARQARVRICDQPLKDAKPIITAYETLSSGPVSRLRVRLLTGRTHQIRAHLAALGHPVLGDDLYGDRALNRREKARGLKLCAVSLTLHTGGRLPALDGRRFEIEPPF